MEFKGTPGKWLFTPNGEHQIAITNDSMDRVICFVPIRHDKVTENTKLILSAPELLESLQEMRSLLKSICSLQGWDEELYSKICKSDLVINKALGL